MPWARLYKRLSTEADVLAYSLVRTQEREYKFIWIAPLYHVGLSVVSLAKRNLPARSIHDIRANVIGIKRNDVVSQYLLKNSFEFGKNLIEVKDTSDTLQLLLKGRVDCIPATPIVIEAACKALGCKPSEFKFNFEIPELPQNFYLAASLNSSPLLIERLKKAAELLQQQETSAEH